MNVQRSKDRIKQTGEIFTPLPLVDEILSKLPEETWEPSKTFIDPACGEGNFLVRVIAWKIWKGSTAEQALQTTYGVDLMDDNVERAKSRVLTAAFSAEAWSDSFYNKEEPTLILPMNLKNELSVGRGELDGISNISHDKFSTTYYHIVEKNIVCHDVLTYDYTFGEK